MEKRCEQDVLAQALPNNCHARHYVVQLCAQGVQVCDMGRVVPHQYKSQDIVISFVLDPSDLSDKMCLNVRAPEFILKDMSAGRNSSKSGQASSLPDTNCTVTVPAGNRTVNVTSESGNEVPHGWCPEGTVFRIGLEGDPSWTVDLRYACSLASQNAVNTNLVTRNEFRVWTRSLASH